MFVMKGLRLLGISIRFLMFLYLCSYMWVKNKKQKNQKSEIYIYEIDIIYMTSFNKTKNI